MNRHLIRQGIILALLGTVTGFAPLLVTNPRMGVAAHVGGIMNALLLLAVGAVWSEIGISARRGTVATRLLVTGAYGNWATVLLASMTGAREFAPLAGAGHGASPSVEKVTFALITIAVLCTLTGLGLVALHVGSKRHDAIYTVAMVMLVMGLATHAAGPAAGLLVGSAVAQETPPTVDLVAPGKLL